MSEASVADWPVAGAVVDVVTAAAPGKYACGVEDGGDGWLTVSAPAGTDRDPVSLPTGARVEVVWRSRDQLRSVAAELVEVLPGVPQRWRLRAAGAVRAGERRTEERRDAVRAPMSVPMRLTASTATVAGTTVDLSEGGARCLLDQQRGEPVEPSVGEQLRVTVVLPEVTVSCPAEVTRRHGRDDDRVELSLRFVGLPEADQDQLRRQVFARLRELRRRGVL